MDLHSFLLSTNAYVILTTHSNIYLEPSRHLSSPHLPALPVETRHKICSKLTIKTPERRQWRCSGVFIVNFEHISHLVLVVSIVNFEHVIAGWEPYQTSMMKLFCEKNE